MKYKTLFRVLLKVLGVWLTVSGLGQFVGGLGWLMQEVVKSGGSSVLVAPFFLFGYLAPSVIQMLLGVYLFFGGKWIVDKAIPANRPYCPECGYDLTGAASSRCPECDTPFRQEEVRPPRGDVDSSGT